MGHRAVRDVALDRREPAAVGFRSVLAHLADRIELHRPGTIAGADPEHLHELRIAVRRTRVLLAESKGALPPQVRRDQRQAFRLLGQQTGPVRDLDVFQVVWLRAVEELGLGSDAGLGKVTLEIEARRAAAHAELSRLLASDETRTTLEGWRRWLVEPHVDLEPSPPLGPVVARRIDRAQDRLLRAGRAITPRSPSNRLHDLRKDAKRLRYLVEGFAPILETGARKAFVAQLRDLQDNLGAHQDAEVQLDLVRLLARDLDAAGQVDVDTLLTVGRVTDGLVRRQTHERHDFDDRFARYDRKRNRRALARLLAEVR
jgi:CHAD domain-containing protein